MENEIITKNKRVGMLTLSTISGNVMIDVDQSYIDHCQIPAQYKGTLQRGYYTAEQVANFKAIWQNAPTPRAWIPIEIYELEIKALKGRIRTALNSVLDSISETIK